MKEKLSLISELIELAKVDNVVTDDEVAFIKTIGNSIGLDDTTLLDLFKNPVKFDPETSEINRIIQFHRLVLLMNVDGEAEFREILHMRQLGVKMGLNPRATNEVLDRMTDYENNVIPPNDLIAIFQKHHN